MKEEIKVNEFEIKNEIIDAIDRFVNEINKYTDSLNYTKIWTYVITQIIQYFVGLDDLLEEITIKGRNDKGEKYTIKVR